MAFRHRKLLNESAAEILDSLCEGDCDAYRNPDGVCSLKCMDYCPSVCKFPIFETPPPIAAVIRSSPMLKSHRLSILLTATLAAAFLLLTCYTIYRLYYNWRSSRRRRQQEGETGADDLLEEDLGPAVDHPIWYIRTIGLQPSVIGAITIVRYNKGEGLVDGTDCSVCLNEFQHDETLRLLPKCNHAFHLPCIDTWLRSHTNCPLCRAGIVSNTAGLPSQAQNSQIPVPDPVEEPLHELSGRIIRREVDMIGVETESSDSMIGVVSGDEIVSGAQNEPKVNEEGLLDGIKPTRRTISMNSLSAMANAFPDRNLDNHLVESKVSTCGVVGFNRSSTERPIEAGPSSVKRSLSCGETVFMSSHASMNEN